MHKSNYLIFWILTGMFVSGVAFAETTVSGLRFWDAPDNTRIVFDLSSPTGYSVFTLKKPDRIVVDLKEARFDSTLPDLNSDNAVIREIRASARKHKDFRFVLDMKDRINPSVFLLKPNEEYGHRLVIDLPHPESKTPSEPLSPIKKRQDNEPRDIVIAIDAGHGGEDPGAHGRYGTKEKDVVLSIAHRLEQYVNKTPGMRAVMIRKGDYYVSLRKRIKLAREYKADLFVSIHADAYKNPRVSGSSVYVLSARGASDEASRWLEARENSADLMGGVSLDDKDDVLASVLLDLSLSGTIDVSSRVANVVLREMGKVGKVRKKQVQYARFVVLKSPDIPSMLIETAFISNPREERRLRSASYQSDMAKGILSGIKHYFKDNPPPGTEFAELEKVHHIRRGDSLSSIAARYSIDIAQLKSANGLNSNVLQVGQELQIP